MDNKQHLQQYITESLAHGYAKDQIVRTLQRAGWPSDIIDQALIQEQTMLVPPAPIPEAQQSGHARSEDRLDFIKNLLAKDLLLAFVFAIVMAIIFKLILPSPEDQAIYGISAALSGSILPAGVFPIMVTTIVVGIVYALILRLALKYKGASGIILAALAGDFLALIAEQDRVIGWEFILGLLITYPLAQVIAHYANKHIVSRICYVIATVILLVLSMRVLNLGHL